MRLGWAAVWTVLTFASHSYAQPSPQGSYTPTQEELVALIGCEQAVFGEMGKDKKIRSGTYDVLYGQWMIVGERTEEIIKCLVERHGWIGLGAPDGRRGARAPR